MKFNTGFELLQESMSKMCPLLWLT